MVATPYPLPTSGAVTAVMKSNPKRDTGPELRLRSALHRLGLRFRKDYPIGTPDRRPIRVDIVFPRVRLAVFVDGCFWHACPEHGTHPRANSSFWTPKLSRNVQRDKDVDRTLADAGWTVIRAWEHEEPKTVADSIARAVQGLRTRSDPHTFTGRD